MIIDIRSPEKYLNGHIKDAINVPYDELFYHPSRYLEKDKKYYIYCDTGIKSGRIVNSLNRMGYNCVNIEGGYYKNMFVE